MSRRFHQRLKAYFDGLSKVAKAIGEYIPESEKIYAAMKAILFREVEFAFDEMIDDEHLDDKEFDRLAATLILSHLRAMNNYANFLKSIS